MYKYILFDFDGTLIDSNEIIINALNATSLHFKGEELTNSAIDTMLGKPLKVQMQAIREENWEALDAYYRNYYRTYRDSLTQIFAGVDDMLKKLTEAGCKLGIVSNKGRSGIEHALEKFCIASYFDVVISSDDVVEAKPSKECVDRALEALGGEISETLLVGDSIHDIECGKNAGVSTALVGWTIIDKISILQLKPDYVVETPEDIVTLIKI